MTARKMLIGEMITWLLNILNPEELFSFSLSEHTDDHGLSAKSWLEDRQKVLLTDLILLTNLFIILQASSQKDFFSLCTTQWWRSPSTSWRRSRWPKTESKFDFVFSLLFLRLPYCYINTISFFFPFQTFGKNKKPLLVTLQKKVFAFFCPPKIITFLCSYLFLKLLTVRQKCN